MLAIQHLFEKVKLLNPTWPSGETKNTRMLTKTRGELGYVAGQMKDRAKVHRDTAEHQFKVAMYGKKGEGSKFKERMARAKGYKNREKALLHGAKNLNVKHKAYRQSIGYK